VEQLTRAEMSHLTEQELEDYTEARMVWNANLPTVKTHQLSSAFAVIDQVMASNRRDADRLRGSVVIDAAPGLGKTTIATRYARDFHRRTKTIAFYGHPAPPGPPPPGSVVWRWTASPPVRRSWW